MEEKGWEERDGREGEGEGLRGKRGKRGWEKDGREGEVKEKGRREMRGEGGGRCGREDTNLRKLSL